MDVNKDDSVTAIRTLAKQRCYHPIREYLQDVAESYKDVDTSIIDNLSTELFGNDSEICNIYMKRFLIGSVARMMRPGTKMDNALILHGAEGIKKSTFWNVLFGDDWFSDSIDDSNAKDEKMLIHEYWCLEWSEFATVYKHKDIEALKKFLAQKMHHSVSPTNAAYPNINAAAFSLAQRTTQKFSKIRPVVTVDFGLSTSTKRSTLPN
ncbi:MAG: hypothetical protein HC894_27825 [Microcoleus sp. SM1_3_4]|nr:hypothetical protein [Microcoleus sp. SM1_3_4]